MSCCFSKKLFSRRSHREDRYKVEEANGEPKPAEATGEAPKYSWDRREKTNPEDYTVKDVKDKTVRKVGKDGGPLEIDNCQDATIIFLHTSSQVMIDNCSRCTIVLGPCQGSVFLRDSSNCTIFTPCQQLRTRDCKSIRIGILCPTEPIIENSSDIRFFHLAMRYPQLKDQMHSVGLRPFTNHINSVHDFTPAAPNGKGNFLIFSDNINLSSGQEEILKVNTVILKPSPADFIPRFSEIKDNDPTYAYICGKSEPVDELGDSAIELLHSVYKAKMEVMSSYDVEVKTVDPKLISFAGNAERVIILELSGDLLKLEYDMDMGVIQQDEMEQFQKLLIHLNSKKSG
ncbi:unnamed protein product [Caenorhabditis nigoni]